MVDLILRRGDIQGRAAMGSGAIWGQTIANVGSSIGQGLERRNEQKKVNAQEDARLRTETALGEAFERPELWEDPQLAIKTFAAAGVPVKEAFGYVKSMQDFRGLQETPDPDKARASLPGIGRYFLALSPEGRAGAYPALRKTLIASQLGGEQDYPPGWSEEMIPQVEALAQLEKQAAPAAVGSPAWMMNATPEEKEAYLANETAQAGATRAPEAPPSRESEWALVPGDPTQERSKFTGDVRPSGVQPKASGKAPDPVWGTASTDAERKRVGVTRTGLAKLSEWKTWAEDNPDLIGPIEGRKTLLQQKTGIGATVETGKKKAQMAILRNAVLNALSGAAVNPQEFERLREQVPEIQDSEEDFYGKIEALDEYFREVLQDYRASPRAGTLEIDPSRGTSVDISSWNLPGVTVVRRLP